MKTSTAGLVGGLLAGGVYWFVGLPQDLRLGVIKFLLVVAGCSAIGYVIGWWRERWEKKSGDFNHDTSNST